MFIPNVTLRFQELAKYFEKYTEQAPCGLLDPQSMYPNLVEEAIPTAMPTTQPRFTAKSTKKLGLKTKAVQVSGQIPENRETEFVDGETTTNTLPSTPNDFMTYNSDEDEAEESVKITNEVQVTENRNQDESHELEEGQFDNERHEPEITDEELQKAIQIINISKSSPHKTKLLQALLASDKTT